MKNNLLIFMLLLLPGLAICQNKALNKFYRQHKHEQGVKNMKLPGWVIRLGSKIARNKAESETEKDALGLMRHFGKVKFMYSEEGVQIPAEKVSRLRQDLLNNHFDDLIMIKSEGMHMQIMVQEFGDIIQNIMMVFNDTESGEMFFISAKANLSLKELSKVLQKEMPDKLTPLFDVEEEEPVDVSL
ncbi:MAG: DUF4252 domain-containing protein [Saprospiraceae bacterium]|nr:DUF4252 domain-containing protein [Saprospiraceae bacterium]